MTSVRRDPLLGGTDWLLTALLALLAIVGVVSIVTLPVVWLSDGGAVGRALDVTIKTSPPVSPAVISALLIGALALCALGFDFIRNLRTIVRSVAIDQQFTVANADRLTRMAWLVVAVQAVLLLMGGVLLGFGRRLDPEPGDWNVELPVLDPSWVVLALVLFILARVFRQGAAMRADLEGTI